MEGSPRLTSRANSAQVVPEGATVLVHRIAPSKSSKGADAAAVVPALLPGCISSEEVQRRVQYDGRAAVKANTLFYLRMLGPITIVSVSMFALFAVLSWAVPNKLCKDYIMETSGSSLGLSKCVFNDGGGYLPFSGAKVFWLFHSTVETCWLAVFPGFICKAIFGSCMSMVQVLITLASGAVVLAVTYVTAIVFDLALNNFYVVGVSAVGSLLVVLTCSSAAVRFAENPLMRWRWIFLFALAGAVNTFYLFVMPMLITARSSEALSGMGLTVIRLLVHPLIWAVVLFFFRTFMRHIGRVKDLTQVCFLVWPVLYSSLYGRFLLLQLDDVGSVVMMNFMLSCFAIAGELVDRGTDQWWLGLLYGSRARDAMLAVRAVDEMELVNQLTTTMMEAASIVSAAALLSFGGVAAAPGVPPDHSLIWFNAFAQLATTLVFNFVEIAACGKFHNVEWAKVYPRRPGRFLAYVMAVLLIGGMRLCVELLLLFCPRHYEEHGILLEECDKPSLFQAFRFNFAHSRAKVEGEWLDL